MSGMVFEKLLLSNAGQALLAAIPFVRLINI